MASEVPDFGAFHEAAEVCELYFVGLGKVVLFKNVLVDLAKRLLYLLLM